MTKAPVKFFTEVGLCLAFMKKLVELFRAKSYDIDEVYDQIWAITKQSSLTTALAGFFVGAIMTVQFAVQVKEFGALSFLGGLSTSATVREIGPLLIGFMLSGKIGAYTSAELGTMKVTEQMDAIRCLGADPMREIILPRFFGIIISSFFLLFIGLLMSIFGGMFIGMVFSGITPEEYVRHIPTILTIPSIGVGLFKCLVFAFVLATICTYIGYTAHGGAKGVGRAVVATAVGSMVGIVIADWVTSIITESIGEIILSI